MSLRSIADRFALKIVAGEYGAAFSMLSVTAKQEWNAQSLQDEFEAMYENIDIAKPRVVTEWNDESGTTKFDDGTLLYVPIDSNDPWSEAISVFIDNNNEIVEVEFGRP